MQTRRIEIVEMPNYDYVTVNFNFELISDYGASFHRRSGLQNLSGETKQIVQAILAINGISSVVVYPYKITLEKGRLFTFDDIANEIIQSISALYNPLESSVHKRLVDFGVNGRG